MKANERLNGKEMYHPDYGKVMVLKAVEGSRTKVEFKVLQRKEGWNEYKETYEKIRMPNRKNEGGVSLNWKIHNRDEYGKVDECHINQLNKLC